MRTLRAKLWGILTLLFVISISCSQLPVTFPITKRTSATATLTPTEESEMEEVTLPPTVVEFNPRAGQRLATEEAVISVLFDQAMDKQSVEAALQLFPEVEGEFSWQSERELHFTPKVLASAKEYQVSVGTDARSKEGLKLGRALTFSFSTRGPLEVTQVTPTDEAVDFRSDTPLLISFNQPVVALNCTGQVAGKIADCPELPLNVNPRITGQGFWVNTSLYRFDPRLGWKAGQLYELELARTFTSVVGTTLEDPYRWNFTPAEPRILTVQPQNGRQDVLLDAAVRVNFSTPMDPEATGSAFSLTAQNGEIVPGSLTWADEGAELVFTPTQRLELGTRYLAVVNQQARALTGAPLEAPLNWTFSTVPYPVIWNITPTDGEEDIAIYKSVQLTFMGAMDKKSVAEQLLITPTVAAKERYLRWEGETLHLSWDKKPRTEYCVSVPSGVSDIYGHRTRESLQSCFTTGDLRSIFAPTTRLEAITLDAAEPAEIYVLSRNVNQVALDLEAITANDFLSYDQVNGTALRRWSERFNIAPNEVGLTPLELTARGNALPTGYYQLSWALPESEGWRSNLRLAVVDTNLTLKMSTEEALIWATDLSSGRPLTETEVQLLNGAGTLVAAGTTDVDGLARLRIGPLESLWDRYLAVLGEPGQPQFGVAVSNWDTGARPWDFDIAAQYGNFVPYNIYLYSDRPIYRPGQQVHVRGILRAEQDVRYSLPELDRTVELSLRDPRWEIIYTTTATLSELGGFEADFELSSVAEIGEYSVQAQLEGLEKVWELPFAVAAYRKPEFEVTVTPEMDDLLQGEMARVLVDSSYYFGGAVSAAPLSWRVYAQPAHFTPNEGVGWRWGTGGWWLPPEPELIAQGETTTDTAGRFLLELPAELAALEGEDEESTPGSQNWEFEVTVTDEAGFPVTGRGELTVHATRFYLGAQPRQWLVAAGEAAKIDLWALDWEGVPVAGREVEVKLAQRQWYHVPPAEPFAQPTWAYTDTTISDLEVETDAQGRAEALVTPPTGGSYVILANATDAEGRLVQTESQLWVSGPGGMAWRMAEGRVTPVADADSYQPGETASILLPTPFEGPFQVLMTVERGSILETQRLVFEEANPTIELPIKSAYAPNVYLSFVVVKGKESLSAEDELLVGTPDVRLGLVELQVEPVAQTLQLELSAVPEQDSYRPGDQIELTVRTVDAEGRTVDSEVGLAVVDKAVLALKEPNAPSMVEGFYGQRPLGVRTGSALLVLFNRLTADLEELAENAERLAEEMSVGGMGGGGGGAPARMEVRSEFPATALWETRLRTGLNGETTVSFELPDSLTTWQVDARAVTADTKVGAAVQELIVSKPLLVRPVTPRFFVAGDQLSVAGVVHNNSSEQLQAVVRLDASAIAIEGESQQTVTIPAGSRQRVSWLISVPAGGADEALLTFSVSSGMYEDSTRPALGRPPDQALPIYRYESQDVVGSSGVLAEAGSRMEVVALPPSAGEDTELNIHLDTSLAASLLEGLTYLENYPYGCTEQLVSRFLPNLLTYRALQELDLVEPELAERLPGLVREGLEQLYSRQNEDGGWGWWAEGGEHFADQLLCRSGAD